MAQLGSFLSLLERSEQLRQKAREAMLEGDTAKAGRLLRKSAALDKGLIEVLDLTAVREVPHD